MWKYETRPIFFFIDGEHSSAPKAFIRRFILWSIVCWASAGPSFLMAIQWSHAKSQLDDNWDAHDYFNPTACACGIVLFSILYTVLTGTNVFNRFQRIPGIRTTFHLGVFTRLGLSIVYPIGFYLDFFTALYHLRFLTASLFQIGHPFSTFILTCTQGLAMNIVIGVYMLIVYIFVPKKPHQAPRGFEVILPEEAAMTATPTDPSTSKTTTSSSKHIQPI